MKETILEYIKEYAPVVLMLVMMFIDRFGFGNIFSSFRKDITDSFDVKLINKTFESLKEDLRSVNDELKDLRDEVKKEREAIQRIRGSKQ